MGEINKRTKQYSIKAWTIDMDEIKEQKLCKFYLTKKCINFDNFDFFDKYLLQKNMYSKYQKINNIS